jgi:hypothetical protein
MQENAMYFDEVQDETICLKRKKKDFVGIIFSLV